MRDIHQISVSGTAPDSYKQKTPATRLYLPNYGTLAQSLIHLGTVSFLRVYSKVLGTYTHALALHTLYKGGSDKTCYDWIF